MSQSLENEKKRYIDQIAAGDLIEDVFVLAERSLCRKKDGSPYLNVTLSDRTGQIRGVVWDNVERIVSGVGQGDYVRVSAAAGEYRGCLQLVVKSLAAVSADSVEPSAFLPTTPRNIESMFERLRLLTDTISFAPLKELMSVFWADAEFVKQFKRAPAAKKMHHAYLGGLLEHTLSMAMLADKISAHYSGLDRDLLLAGAVLHDIGKVRELSFTTSIDYTDEGRLLSHIVIGLEMLEQKLRMVPDFPPAQAAVLKHLLVSHHGAREYGSPEPPKTIEAVLLNYIDEIDSRVNAIREFMASEEADGSWTPYHRLLERHFYRGNGRT